MKVVKSVVLLLALMISAVSWAGSVNINTADASTLAQSIKGVGDKRAQAIVDYREQNGAFKTIDGLSNVKGIGAAIVDKNRDNLAISGN